MLEYLRNASNKPLAKILMGVLMFSFVGWGVADWVLGGGRSDDALVMVGGNKVSPQSFEREKSREVASLSKEQQKQIYTVPAAAAALNRQVLQTLTLRAMLDARAQDIGLGVSEREIASIIKQTPDFQQDGKFSTVAFDYALQNAGLTETLYADSVRGAVLRGMLMMGINMSAPVPDFAVKANFNARYATRKIKLARVKFDDFKVAAQPTQEQLNLLNAQNPKMIAEHRAVSYVLVNADMGVPDSFDKGYATAQKIEDLIIGGESLDAAAKKYDAKFVSLPSIHQASKLSDSVLTDEMTAKVFGMEQGIESEIIETKKGFVIVRVEKIIASHAAEMDGARKAELANLWKKEEQKKQAYLKANEKLVDLNSGKGFDGQELTVSRTSGANIAVLSAAFSSPVGTKTIVPGEDAYYVLWTEKELPAVKDDKKIAELRKEISVSYNRNLADDYMGFLSGQYPVKPNEKLLKRMAL